MWSERNSLRRTMPTQTEILTSTYQCLPCSSFCSTWAGWKWPRVWSIPLGRMTMISIPTGSLTEIYRRVLQYHYLVSIRHVNEHPIYHYFGNPRHAQSIIAYKNSTEYFWKIPVKNCIVGMLLSCPVDRQQWWMWQKRFRPLNSDTKWQ